MCHNLEIHAACIYSPLGDPTGSAAASTPSDVMRPVTPPAVSPPISPEPLSPVVVTPPPKRVEPPSVSPMPVEEPCLC